MIRSILALLLMSVLISCKTKEIAQLQTLESPGKTVSVNIGVTDSGQPWYAVAFNGKPVIIESLLGLIVEELDLREGFKITGMETRSFDETWNPVWGEVDEIREHYNEIKLTLQSKDKRKLVLFFRAFDDGLGFRYEVPEQNGLKEAKVLEEITQFKMTADHKTWWIPGDWDSNEHIYTTSKVSQIDATPYNEVASPIHTQHIVYVFSVQTPADYDDG